MEGSVPESSDELGTEAVGRIVLIKHDCFCCVCVADSAISGAKV